MLEDRRKTEAVGVDPEQPLEMSALEPTDGCYSYFNKPATPIVDLNFDRSTSSLGPACAPASLKRWWASPPMATAAVDERTNGDRSTTDFVR